jgi:hypothetical protein
MSEDNDVTEFRRRIAAGEAQWLIDIQGARSVRLVLTKKQQDVLRRATKQTFTAATLVLQSVHDDSPVRSALCNLEPGDDASRQ